MSLILNPYRFAAPSGGGSLLDNIRTTNLIAAWDAGDTNSYPGTGSTWFDLTDNNRDLTLTLDASFDSSGGGCIDFDGLGDDANITDAALSSIGEGDHTMIAWVNLDALTEEDIFVTAIGNGGILFMLYQNNLRGHCWTGSGVTVVDSTSFTFSTGNWYMVAQRADSTDLDVWINNSQNNSTTLNGGYSTNSGTDFEISGRYRMNGRVAIALIYDAYLSDSDIQNIYSETNGRFT